MFGLENDELAALVGVTLLSLRVMQEVGKVIWWYVTDARRIVSPNFNLTLLTGGAVALMAIALVSIATGGPPRGFRTIAYMGAGVGGFILGSAFDFVLTIRLWRVSDWLTRRRIPRYREQLLHGDSAVRLHAARQLASLGLYARVARPELLAAFTDESADVRATAVEAVLYAIPEPPDDDADVPKAARALLTDPARPVRIYAAAVLVAYNLPAADVLPALTDGLMCDDINALGMTARALGRLGPAAEPAIPALRDSVLRRDEPNYESATALGKIGPPAVPALIEILDHNDKWGKYYAANALCDMGEPARAALPGLRKAATHPDSLVSAAAKKAIEKLGGDIR
jgi:hypothetical protein